MSVLGDIFSGRLRQEMRQRVDAVLRAGNEWCSTARDLVEALNKLTNSIQQGNVNPVDVKIMAKSARTVAKKTEALTKAFLAHNKMLSEVLARYG